MDRVIWLLLLPNIRAYFVKEWKKGTDGRNLQTKANSKDSILTTNMMGRENLKHPTITIKDFSKKEGLMDLALKEPNSSNTLETLIWAKNKGKAS